jgi:AraC-like DNA-binding protein
MIGLIRSASLTNYAEVARKVGLEPHRLLAEFGLPPRCLREPEMNIPIDAVRGLLEASAERSGTASFGLLMAEARRLSSLGPLGLLIREQPTLRLAVETLARYGNRLNAALFLTVDESGDVVVLREELIVGGGGEIRQSTELAIGVAFRILRIFLGADWRPLRVCFAHDAPADRGAHERVFGRNVEFGHDFNGIVCARSDLEISNPNADPGIARMARQMLEAAPTGREADMTSQVRELVVMLLPTGTCTIERIAQNLGVDRRTVHRHLVRESQSFSRIVQAVRLELAERYVKEPRRALTEVASLLGFSAPSVFSRWHRRHFGARPSARRAGAPPAKLRTSRR